LTSWTAWHRMRAWTCCFASSFRASHQHPPQDLLLLLLLLRGSLTGDFDGSYGSSSCVAVAFRLRALDLDFHGCALALVAEKETKPCYWLLSRSNRRRPVPLQSPRSREAARRVARGVTVPSSMPSPLQVIVAQLCAWPQQDHGVSSSETP